jgi:uncharacterized damage-inducible protein DinB
MKLSKQTAKHLREVYFGGNWTASNVKETLSDLTWKEANLEIGSFNTIAILTNHISYYVPAVLEVLKGNALVAKDELSFAHPPINNQEEWDAFLENIWSMVIEFCDKIETLDDAKFFEDMLKKKYGNYFRNLHGIIEHTHYHLGQIVLLKKLIREKD